MILKWVSKWTQNGPVAAITFALPLAIGVSFHRECQEVFAMEFKVCGNYWRGVRV